MEQVLQSGATFVTEWGNYYKAVSTKGKWEKRGKAKDFVNLLLYSPLIFEWFRFCYNRKEEELTPPP